MSELANYQPCPHCGRYKNRRVAVDAVIVQESKILLIKRGVEPFKGMWALPGGGVEFDETAEEALRKEVLEEAGLTVKSMVFLQVYTDPKRDPKQAISLAYVVHAEGEPKAGDDARAYKWFGLHDLPELAFDHGKIIEDYLNKSSLSG